jgi:hypothetical protein
MMTARRLAAKVRFWISLAWVVAVLLAFAVLLEHSASADERKGELITELGMGYKIPQTTSTVLLPQCHQVHEIEFRPAAQEGDSYWGRNDASCGGDNPIFVGWPIA